MAHTVELPRTRAERTRWLLVFILVVLPSLAPAQTRRELGGHVPDAVARLQPVAQLSADTPMDLILGLPVRNEDQPNSLLADLYDPASPRYGQYLEPAEYTELFGPTAESYDALLAFARASGLGEGSGAVAAHQRIQKTCATSIEAEEGDAAADKTPDPLGKRAQSGQSDTFQCRIGIRTERLVYVDLSQCYRALPCLHNPVALLKTDMPPPIAGTSVRSPRSQGN